MELKFLQQDDFLAFISENSLRKLVRGNESKLAESENTAYGHVYDKLSQRYKISLAAVPPG